MALVSGTVNSDILNAADGITSGGDFVYGGDGHDTIRGLGGNDFLFGEDGRDTLYGGDGLDWLYGGKNDDKLYGGDEFDWLYGDKGQDELYGENDNDWLDGGAGADLLDGGDGRDTASYDTSDAGVHVSLAPVLPVGSGNSGGYAEGDTLVSIEDLYGSNYDDELYGNDQTNYLDGGDGNDCLYGGDAADYMFGGPGNDTYTVDDAGDVVVERAQEGIDTVDASINYTLGDDVENLVLTGGSGLSGTGNDLDNTITGNGGNNTLDGGAGADTMIGGLGNDTYVVDDAGDVVTEYAQEGIDTVDAVINYTLGDDVENLVLTGGSGLSGTGNDLDNVIMGNDSDNLLSGGGGEDSLEGMGGADTLDGGTGADTLIGGQGFDIFIVDDAGDVVLENTGEGFDQVQTSVSYTLAAGAEVEVLYADPATATAQINLIGNEFDNFLTGNDGINVLVSGLGVDTLRGNGSADAFLWSFIADTGLNNPDVVTDYSSAQGDVLHFTNMDADDTVAGNQDFTLIGTAAFTAPGQINWFTNGTDTFIQLNTNADLAADAIVQLNGVLSGDSVLIFL
jgi:Ca2+-binding RTX toxin-like protein